MFFRVKSTSPNSDLAIYRARRTARLRLSLYRIGPSELLLSRYLQENFNMTLQSACLAILQNARFALNIKHELIITIPDKQLNEISKLITYGTGKVAGSHILQDMWRITEKD